MSIESARTIIERMDHDQEFAALVKRCRKFAELQEIFAREGLDVTEEELMEEMSALTDSDLEEVAGGGIENRQRRSCHQLFQDGFHYVLCEVVPLAK